MERMDGVRRLAGLIWVGAGLVFQVILLITDRVRPGPITLTLCALIVALTVSTLATRPGRSRWLLAWGVSVALALDFLGAVLDRFGVFGPPGAPGVSWGSWEQFTTYTSVLLGGSATWLSALSAMLATTVEIFLVGLLLVGRQRRWAGKITAGLLVVYLVSMSLTLGPDDVALFAVPILVGGALLISAVPARRRAWGQGAEPADDRDDALRVTDPRP